MYKLPAAFELLPAHCTATVLAAGLHQHTAPGHKWLPLIHECNASCSVLGRAARSQRQYKPSTTADL